MKLVEWIDPFSKADGTPPATLFAFLRWSFKGAFGAIAIGGAVSILAGTLEVLSALILGIVIDAALQSDTANFFDTHWALLIAVSAFFLLLRPLTLGIAGVLQAVLIGPAIANLIQIRLYRHTIGQSVSFFDDDFAGRIAQKQNQATRAGANLVIETIHTILFAIASLVGSVILMVSIDVRTGMMLAVWVVCYVFLIRFFMPRIRKASKERAGQRAMVTGQIVDTVTNIKTVKLFAHDKFEDQAALNAVDRLRHASIRFGWVSATFRFCLMTLAGILPLIMVGSTLYFWSQGGASAGDIAISGTIGLRLAQMTGWVSFTLMSMYADIGEVEDAMRTLSSAHQLLDSPNAQKLELHQGAISIRDLSFRYNGGIIGLDNINLEIGSGERLGIVGASGAGKSTLVALILRLYDADKGSIMFDGQEIKDVSQESLRQQIGMVTQETAMFNRSARDNILYGNPNASDGEVVAAAKYAEADGFIQDLRDHVGREGYDAHLGERGVKLSGGQRQRIAIARAILKDAPILILDEATSALDSEVEASIQTALETAMERKTVIAIAHRLSTLSQMDRIIVLDHGRIVEDGTHQQLLSNEGLYARYWKRQSGGFIDVESGAE